MKLKHTIKTAYDGLRTNRKRSLLTILGVVIGVAAIIIVMAVGNGAQSLILDQISGLGQETVIIRPGQGVSQDFTGALISKSLTEDDVEALRQSGNVPNLTSAHPYVLLAENISYRSEDFSPTMLGGSVKFIAETLDVDLAEGAFFTQSDIDANSRVVVIGQDAKEELFGISRAVGEDVQIANRDFEIVGVFANTGQSGPFNFDDMVIMPQTAAHTYITGDNSYQEVLAQADTPENVDKLVYDITATLREEHDLQQGDENDFDVQTQENLIEQVSTVTTILSAFLIAMLSVALVVGGIGIMNIMLVSVTERTKEIGLRKALGATSKDIQRQFLTEAVMLTVAGGIFGIVSGTAIAWGASLILSAYVVAGWVFVFPFGGAILGVVAASAIGLLFGIYPARKAAEKSPIEALRYE